MDYFYDGQFKNVLSQFTRIFSFFKYRTGVNHTGKEEMLPVPCRYGSISRLAGAIQRKNSENVALSAPFISCWISNISVARERTMNPSHVNTVVTTEREFDYTNNRYKSGQGNTVTIERLVPVPYNITMQVDIWSTNEEMKLQILEQILVLFNPAIDFQKNENPYDWSALGMVELESINYSSRSVPVGNDDNMEVTSLTFQVQHFYLNPPAKVKTTKLIQNIYTNVFMNEDTSIESWEDSYLFTDINTYKNAQLRVIDNEATLVSNNNANWKELFENLGIKEKENYYYIKLFSSHPNVTAPFIIDIESFSQVDDTKVLINLNTNTLPAATLDAVDDIINPNSIFPDNGLDMGIGKRYLITNDIVPNTEAWGVTSAHAGSIITTLDGVNFVVDFNSNIEDTGNIVKNLSDNELYVQVDVDLWVNLWQGTYRAGYWRLISKGDDIGV